MLGAINIKNKNKTSFIAKIGHLLPDPVVIFIFLYIITLLFTVILDGKTFSLTEGNTYTIRNMLRFENIRWIFSNAILTNWISYASGILGIILFVMFGIGLCDESGLLSAIIKKISAGISDKYLAYMIVFLGILSNLATDAGYIILVPLAGLLYAGLGQNPLIGMAAAFAGVSAGFSANLVPASVADVVVGTNALGFSENQSIPFVSFLGKEMNPVTMNYYFMVASTFLLVFLGGFITNKIIKPRLSKHSFVLPQNIVADEFNLSQKEQKALKYTLFALIISVIISALLAIFPLKSYIDESGKKITPFLDNVIIIVTFIFFVCGYVYGKASGKFKNTGDVISAMSKQVGSMGYVIVLTFFCYNFLSMLTYSNLGAFITYVGATTLLSIGLSEFPFLLLIGFIIITAIINLFVGGLSAKWMLLGPIFLPMLYHVNHQMTPDVIAAAYRLADSSTNVITPLMSYTGLILLYMRKYEPDYNIGDLIALMLPYSIIFLILWTILLFLFIIFKIPLGF